MRNYSKKIQCGREPSKESSCYCTDRLIKKGVPLSRILTAQLAGQKHSHHNEEILPACFHCLSPNTLQASVSQKHTLQPQSQFSYQAQKQSQAKVLQLY